MTFALSQAWLQLDAEGVNWSRAILRSALVASPEASLPEEMQQNSREDVSAADFEEVVARHSDLVYNVALRMMGRAEDAEDVAQDAFLAAYRAFGRFRGESKVSTWLYRITVNAALMRLRKEKRGRELTRTGLEDVEIPDWREGPDVSASNSELGDRLREGLDMLPHDLKAAVILRDVEGLSTAESASALDITVSSLKSRLHRGRVLLRKQLEEYLKVRD